MGIVLGCHWGVCGRFGTDIPELDEWDAEGINLFVPQAHHDLRFHDFWAIHVDHHVLLTRALAYVETTVNGAWDQRLETVVNAVLAGGIAAALSRCIGHGDIPYVGVEATQMRLNMPELRPLLPASIRGATYRAPIGSRLARWLTHAGWAVAAAAAAGAVLLCL